MLLVVVVVVAVVVVLPGCCYCCRIAHIWQTLAIGVDTLLAMVML